MAVRKSLSELANCAGYLELPVRRHIHWPKRVAGWLAPQYLLAAREELAGTEGARRWEILRLFAQDWATLRQGDHSSARLQLDRERLAFERRCAERAKMSEFWKWTKRPEIKRKLWPPKKGGLTKTTLRKIERELNLL